MRIRFCLLLIAAMIAGRLSAQKSGEVLFTVGKGDTVTVEEFKYIYEKNNANEQNLYSKKNVMDYLELYKNFKLKVHEARELGMDTVPKFLKEYNNYRKQLSQPYLTDRSVTQQIIDQAYNRMKYELRASHILIPVAIDAAPKDTLEAYKITMALHDSAIGGKDFEELARKYSKDPSVASNGGDLGYFTVFHMIYPFETAAYGLKKAGEVSMPVRTRYGYHLIKLTDRRPYRGEVRVRHILINSANSDPNEKLELAKEKVDSIFSLLHQGASFEELARQYSDHIPSKQSGGELPPFNSFAQLPEIFKDSAFALQKEGSYSHPFKSNFGWHIVQLIARDSELRPEKELSETLKQRISKDTRSEKSREAALARFKQDYNYKVSRKALKKFRKGADTTLLHGNYSAEGKFRKNKAMFTLDGKEYRQKDFAAYLQSHQREDRFTDLDYALNQYFNEYVDETILAYHEKNLENRYPEFRNVAKEYKEGILLFEITDQKVWNKAMTDSVGLKEFYKQHKDKYRWGSRADAVVFSLRDKSDVSGVMAGLKKVQAPTPAIPVAPSKPVDKKNTKQAKEVKPLTLDSLAGTYTKSDPLRLDHKEGLFEKGDNKAVDTVKWEPGVHDAGLIDGRYYVVKIWEVKPAGFKDLSEVRGMAIADYQDSLEKDWLNNLRSKYEVKVNEAALDKLIKATN